LEVASEYFRSGADKISIGSDAVYAAEEYLRTGVQTSTRLQLLCRLIIRCAPFDNFMVITSR